MSGSFSGSRLSFSLLVACLASASPAARGDSSFKDVTLVSSRQGPGAAAAVLDVESRSEALEREHVALAAQNEVFARQIEALRLRLEALGMGGSGAGESLVEQRLVSAVNDLRHSEAQRKALRDSLQSLVDALAVYLPVLESSDAEAAVVVRSQLKSAHRSLGAGSLPLEFAGSAGAGSRAVVLSIERGLGVIVASTGAESQVRVGTPFVIERGDKVIGRARAVDVRARVCALLLDNSGLAGLQEGSITEGDSVRVDARR